MSLLGQIINEKRNAKKNAAIGQQIQAALGSHADPGQQIQVGGGENLVSQVGGQEATGILAKPVDQRMEALAIAASTIPGYQRESLSMMQTAIRNRQQDSIRAQEFNATLFQDQQQFTVKEEQDKTQWQARQTILDAQHVSNQDLHKLKMAAEMRGVNLDALSEKKQLLQIEKLQQDLVSLPPAGELRLAGLALDFAHVEQQLQEFMPSYAINAVTQVGGQFDIINNRKFAKTDRDRSQAALWAREQEYQNGVISRMSGANVSANEMARMEATFVNPTMNAKSMEAAWEARLTLLNRNKKLFLNQWRDQARNVEQRFGAGITVESVRASREAREQRIQAESGPVPMGGSAPAGTEFTEMRNDG